MSRSIVKKHIAGHRPEQLFIRSYHSGESSKRDAPPLAETPKTNCKTKLIYNTCVIRTQNRSMMTTRQRGYNHRCGGIGISRINAVCQNTTVDRELHPSTNRYPLKALQSVTICHCSSCCMKCLVGIGAADCQIDSKENNVSNNFGSKH